LYTCKLSLRAHKRTRAAVERGIGQLKRRWGLLHGEAQSKHASKNLLLVYYTILSSNIRLVLTKLPSFAN